ncbi:MAG: hypothetical protein GYB21_04125 [Oceanospirillales bacterium]|nr:hypothetical protein [Oceanospirillales bacterium]
MSDEQLLLWILGPLFGAVGLYLVWYARRRRRMMRAFAREHQFPVKRTLLKPLQHCLDTAFALPQSDAVRSFGELSCVVDAGKAWLFLTVELLDLRRYGQTGSTHFARMAAVFKVSADLDAFFLIDMHGKVINRITQEPEVLPRVATAAHEAMREAGAGHTLSVTLANGYGLVYFEPLATGGEEPADLEALCKIALSLHARLFR